MQDIYYENKPYFQHDCDRCKFLMSIKIYDYEDRSGRIADIYESCDKSDMPYLIRFGDEPGEYATVSQKSLFAHWIMTITPNI